MRHEQFERAEKDYALPRCGLMACPCIKTAGHAGKCVCGHAHRTPNMHQAMMARRWKAMVRELIAEWDKPAHGDPVGDYWRFIEKARAMLEEKP